MYKYRKYLAEFFGTFMLVFLGCGSVLVNGESASNLEISICFGATLTVLIYLIGHVSGCHVNPSVTISMMLLNRIKTKDAFIYIFLQCLGAFFASFILFLISLGDFSFHQNGIGQNNYLNVDNNYYNTVIVFIIEILFTVFFIITILVSSGNKLVKYSPLIIGIVLSIIHIVGIPITSVSVNPARSIGPALIMGGLSYSQLWVFILAPIIGAVISSLIWKFFEVEKEFEQMINY